jgi:FMN phosphatase YigB (HAD superfamily)
MKKIIFDLDDTLYIDKELREKREKAILEFLGNKSRAYKKLKKEGSGTIEAFKKLGFERREFFNIIKKIPIELEKDWRLRLIIKKIKKKYKLIVLSNSPGFCVKKTLKKLGIIDLFDGYYSGEDFFYEKPHESCFFMIEKEDICVGNNFKKDLEVPKKLGAVTILICKDEKGLADYEINHIYDLVKILEKIEWSTSIFF